MSKTYSPKGQMMGVALAVAVLAGTSACNRTPAPDEAGTDSVAPQAVSEVATEAVAAQLSESLAPDFSLPDLDGKIHALSDYKGKVVILEWINMDCPFVKKHYSVDAMQALQRKYTAQGMVWLAVCSSAPGKQGHFDVATWKQRAEASNMTPTAILLDESGDVGRAYEATNTPHMYVIDADGVLVYAGAIDDDRSSDSSKVEGAHNYVVAALDAVLSNNAIETPQTRAYGCSVKY